MTPQQIAAMKTPKEMAEAIITLADESGQGVHLTFFEGDAEAAMKSRDRAVAALSPILAALLARSDWIPVGKRLPEEGARIVVASKGGLASIAVHVTVGKMYINGITAWISDYTHWRPLPALPGKE